LKKAQLIKKRNKNKNNVRILQHDIDSEKNGMGVLTFNLQKHYSYYLRISQEGETRDFLIINGDLFKGVNFSNVYMYLPRRVFNQQSMLQVVIEKLPNIMLDSVWLVIQNKTKVLYEKSVDFFQTSAQFLLELRHLNFENGGVLTIQLFRKKSFGVPDQETLIYVHPTTEIKVLTKTYQKTYLPNSTVKMRVGSMNKHNFSYGSYKSKLLWGVVVSDESSFLQVEKKRLPPSLITKVFLENELFFESKEFQGAHRYVDWFFESSSKGSKRSKKFISEKNKLLDLLLGNQKWRMFFLAGNKLNRIIRSNNSLGKDKKGHYEYLLAKRLADLKPKFRFYRRRFMRRGMVRPMAMARGAPPPMAMADNAVPEMVKNYFFKKI
jgi:hypothetical protein